MPPQLLRRFAATLSVAIITNLASAQTKTPEAIVRSVADNVLANTTFRFIDAKTKQTYITAAEAGPFSSTIATESIYNKWHYSNGVLNVGMMAAAKTLGDAKYSEYTSRNFDFIFDNLAYFKQGYDAKQKGEWSTHFRMDILDDFGALSASISDLNEMVNDSRYKAYLDKAAAYALKGNMRLPNGTYSRDWPRMMTVWADDLYMSVPFLARMGRVTGEAKYFDEAIKQVEGFNKLLSNPVTNLYYHCWYQDVAMTGVAHWLRCNGWVAMAQTELLNNLPATHPKRKALIEMLLKQIVGFSRYQDDKTGLWHQLIDKPDSYLETSGTAMFTYTVARAVNEKWIHPSYLTIAQNGWKGVASKIDDKGQIADICIGTGIADNISFYYNRPTMLNDYHGIGAVMLAGLEMHKAQGVKINTGRPNANP